jgi:L-alanine-DL-glutamate epimerase-like enolase superfamily enzyme
MSASLRLILDAPWRVTAGTLVVRGTPRVRAAVRIRLRDADGLDGLGEALPLPGYSRDDAATAERALAAIAARVARGGLTVPEVASDAAPDASRIGCRAAARLDAALAPYSELLMGAPSARFALECALVDLLARRDGVSAAQWMADGRALQKVPVSVLLPDDDRAAIIAAAEAAARGHAVLKLKIARPDRTSGQEDALLAEVRAAADTACAGTRVRPRLRLDANGALVPALAPGRLAALVRYGIELVEEPVAGAALLTLPALPLPWAADESLVDPVLAEALLGLSSRRRPAALVLKPAHLGIARCLILAESAVRRGIGLIVTHSLDGDLGHAAACALAAALPVPPWPCGLAPHPGLRFPPSAQPWLPAPTAPGLGVAGEAGAPCDDTGGDTSTWL